ncbi:MAG TPA: TylF/MycF/NovP-related O-methyltransferase [Usitatibacter sp.]|jgi:asparagine synthase (glutamine-hydrolysing)|nr:TylF/MycF/NovP-related O-methyltransferase [Usitatibacter sp.]
MNVAESIQFLRASALTYCGRPGKLEVVHEAAKRVEDAHVPGIFLEAGVAMGGSAIVIAKTKTRERELRLYDVFEMLPPPSANDDPRSHAVYQEFIAGKAGSAVDRNYVDHASDLLAFTRENMAKLGVDPEAENIKFVKGLYERTLEIDRPVAFAHIDCDWYDSVKLCIERVAGWVSPGGIMLFDDYNSFQGCKKAVDEWLPGDSRFRIVHSGWTVAVQRA